MIFYIYLGYPVLVVLGGLIRNKRIKKGDYQPHVTLLIAAYNEEDSINATIKNKLELDYPKDKLEIIVVSDGSTDGTDAILRKYKQQGVKLLRQEPRAGKTVALNMAVPNAKGEILVFSDANSLYASDALRHLVQNFHDEEVGYVTGKMIYLNPNGFPIGDGCTAYMKYENFLRSLETKLGSIVGVDGGIDAIRKKLYQPMNLDQLPDFVLPLKVVEQGYRVVYEPKATLRESALNSSIDEYRMRVRVSLRALWALKDMRVLLDIRRYKLFSWQLFSHKILRYNCFFFLIGLYLSNLFLWSYSTPYKIFLLAQNFFYLCAFIALFLQKQGKDVGILYLPYFFSLINVASSHAFAKFILRKKQTIWAPRTG